MKGGEVSMAGKGRGWHGDPEGHRRAGRMSTGNPDAYKNLTDEDRARGGRNSRGKR